MAVAPKTEWSSKNTFIASVALLGFSILRGANPPNHWSATHILLNYDHGFAKRALPGSLLKWFSVPNRASYDLFLALSFGIFVAWLALLIWQLRDFARSRSIDAVAATFVYASSVGVVFLSHAVGYWDHLGILLSLAALRISRFRSRIWFIGIGFSIAILIHEAIFVLFYPILFVAMLLQSSHKAKIYWPIVGAVTVLLAGVTWFVSQATVSPEQAASLYRDAQAQANYRLDEGVFHVMTQDLQGNLSLVRSSWRASSRHMVIFWTACVTLPTIMFLISLALRRLKQCYGYRWWWWFSGLSALSPLALNAFGWDIERWGALAVTTSFMLFVAVYQAFPNVMPIEVRARAGTLLSAAALLMVLGAGSEITFFDGRHMRTFPFKRELACLAGTIAGDTACIK